ncbi:MAG: PEP-CTERM sorting domain-containing protein [Verrucomicrobiota bacterium]|jgi:hypothetical protein
MKTLRFTHFLKNRALLTTALAATALWFGANALASNIAALESLGTTTTSGVTLDSGPVVTAILSAPVGSLDGYNYTWNSFLVNDGTGSADIYGSMPTGSLYVPTVGDALTLSGTWSPYHQIPEIETLTSITLNSSGNPVPSPINTSISVASSGGSTSATIPLSLAGYLVEIDNVSLYANSGATTPVSGNFATHANTGLYMKDSGGNIMELYVWASSYSVDGAMGGTAIPTGTVDVVGFLSQSSGFAAELTPMSITVVPEPSSLWLLGGFGLLAWHSIRRRR